MKKSKTINAVQMGITKHLWLEHQHRKSVSAVITCETAHRSRYPANTDGSTSHTHCHRQRFPQVFTRQHRVQLQWVPCRHIGVRITFMYYNAATLLSSNRIKFWFDNLNVLPTVITKYGSEDFNPPPPPPPKKTGIKRGSLSFPSTLKKTPKINPP